MLNGKTNFSSLISIHYCVALPMVSLINYFTFLHPHLLSSVIVSMVFMEVAKQTAAKVAKPRAIDHNCTDHDRSTNEATFALQRTSSDKH